MAPTLKQLALHLEGGQDEVINEVAFIIDEGMKAFAPNRRMEVAQVAIFSREIARIYPHESLADINAFMNGAAMSKYDDGEYYASVDIPRLSKWWRAYLAEKAEARENAERDLRNQRHREAEAVIGSIPGLAEAVAASVLSHKEQAHENSRMVRLLRLKERFKIMTDQDLRDAWPKYKDADTRSVILGEAQSRGLLDASLSAAIRQVEEAAKAEAHQFAEQRDEFPAIPVDPNSQVA